MRPCPGARAGLPLPVKPPPYLPARPTPTSALEVNGHQTSAVLCALQARVSKLTIVNLGSEGMRLGNAEVRPPL